MVLVHLCFIEEGALPVDYDFKANYELAPIRFGNVPIVCVGAPCIEWDVEHTLDN